MHTGEESRVVSVVVPVYFNEPSLAALYERLKAVRTGLGERGLGMEVVFVDDGSRDNSLQELLEIRRGDDAVKVVKHTRNFGSMRAIKTGFRHVTGDCFTILAADLQDPPELILAMADEWLKGAKFVICERRERDDPFVSKLFSAIYYRIVVMTVDPGFPRGGFDLALMDKAMLPYLQRGGKNVYTLLYAYWLGFEPVRLQYKREKRPHGKSRWTFGKKFKAFLDVLLGFSYAPIRMISLIGLVVSTLSFGYGVFIVFYTIFGEREVPGFATITALITFLLGLIIVMLGVIGEYLWRIFDEVQDRPESVVDEIY